jgi:hypothetical protein
MRPSRRVLSRVGGADCGILLQLSYCHSVGNFLVTGATVDVASPVSVPEPGTLPLMAAAMGALGLVYARSRRV